MSEASKILIEEIDWTIGKRKGIHTGIICIFCVTKNAHGVKTKLHNYVLSDRSGSTHYLPKV